MVELTSEAIPERLQPSLDRSATVRRHLIAALAALEDVGDAKRALEPAVLAPPATAHIYRARAQFELLTNYTLWVDTLNFENGTIAVTGWVISPLPRATILVNGEPATQVRWGCTPDDLGEVFDALPAAATSGARFHFEHRIDVDIDVVRIEYCPEGKPERRSRRNAWFFVPPAKERYPLPTDANRSRVIVGDDFAYRIGGATVASRLDEYLRDMTGRGFAEIGNVLDWGCGCARVLRYIARQNVRITGVDIDDVNVAWCTENIPEIEFRKCPLLPPSSFTEDSFDLVFGISVMTHLREPIQDCWLQELSRIVKPSGYVMLSVMGPITQVIGGLDDASMHQGSENGFHVTDETNMQVDVKLDGEHYYINVIHSRWYIEKHWQETSPWKVIDIAPGLAANQDVVLMKNG